MREDPGLALTLGGFLVLVIGLVGFVLFQFTSGSEPGNPSHSAVVAKGW